MWWREKDDGKTLKNARVKFSFGELDGGGGEKVVVCICSIKKNVESETFNNKDEAEEE